MSLGEFINEAAGLAFMISMTPLLSIIGAVQAIGERFKKTTQRWRIRRGTNKISEEASIGDVGTAIMLASMSPLLVLTAQAKRICGRRRKTARRLKVRQTAPFVTKLPKEVRVLILEYCFTEHDTYWLEAGLDDVMAAPLLVCRQMFFECVPLLRSRGVIGVSRTRHLNKLPKSTTFRIFSEQELQIVRCIAMRDTGSEFRHISRAFQWPNERPMLDVLRSLRAIKHLPTIWTEVDVIPRHKWHRNRANKVKRWLQTFRKAPEVFINQCKRYCAALSRLLHERSMSTTMDTFSKLRQFALKEPVGRVLEVQIQLRQIFDIERVRTETMVSTLPSTPLHGLTSS